MTDEKITVNRPLVGIIALTCLGIALYLFVSGSNQPLWLGAFVRVGLVMSALWLALPSKNREAAWARMSPKTFAGVSIALFALIARPQIMKFMLPLLLVIGALCYMLRPRGKQRPGNRPRPEPQKRATTVDDTRTR